MAAKGSKFRAVRRISAAISTVMLSGSASGSGSITGMLSFISVGGPISGGPISEAPIGG